MIRAKSWHWQMIIEVIEMPHKEIPCLLLAEIQSRGDLAGEGSDHVVQTGLFELGELAVTQVLLNPVHPKAQRIREVLQAIDDVRLDERAHGHALLAGPGLHHLVATELDAVSQGRDLLIGEGKSLVVL